MHWHRILFLAVTTLVLTTSPLKAQFLFPGLDLSNPQNPADSARQDADRAYQQGDYATAIQITSQLIDNNASDHVALHLRASARIEQGRNSGDKQLIRDGIADARTALALEGRKHYWLYLPYFYGLTSLAQIERRPGHAEMAITVATPLLDKPEVPAADRANILYQRALAYATTGKTAAAITDLDETTRLSPEHLAAFLKRAQLQAALGQTVEAAGSYDATVVAFPSKPVAYNDRGTFRRSQGDLAGALDDFTRALQIDPAFTMGYINRGITLLDQAEFLAAESDFTSALKQNNRQPFAALLRGTARVASGNSEGALADFSMAISLNPNYTAAYESRGCTHFFRKEYAAAAADFARTLQLDPQSTRVATWQSLSLGYQKKTDESQTALEVLAADKRPGMEWLHQVGNYLSGKSTAEQFLAAAKAAGPDQVCEAHFFMGHHLALTGDSDGSQQSFAECLKTKLDRLSAYRGARYATGDYK